MDFEKKFQDIPYLPQTGKFLELWLVYFAGDDELKKEKIRQYWAFIRGLVEEAKKDLANSRQRKLGSREVKIDEENAQEEIKELVEAGIYPIVSIPKKYWDNEIHKLGGIPASGWLDEKYIVGRLGVLPYLGKPEEERILVRVKVPTWRPRITGKLKTFVGVVEAADKFIPLDRLEEIKNAPQI